MVEKFRGMLGKTEDGKFCSGGPSMKCEQPSCPSAWQSLLGSEWSRSCYHTPTSGSGDSIRSDVSGWSLCKVVGTDTRPDVVVSLLGDITQSDPHTTSLKPRTISLRTELVPYARFLWARDCQAHSL